jgi:N-acetylglucosamine kinase-like BadF-type ATPase
MSAGLLIGVDGGNSKTELAVADRDGALRTFVRGPGSNAHAVGADGCAAVVAALAQAALPPGEPASHGTFFLCGADGPADVAALRAALGAQPWVGRVHVDNDTFALLHAGAARPDAVAVVCGAGINCVGRRADGFTVRYPALGWVTGDWGGGEQLGRDALAAAVRGEDGRGAPTALTRLVADHFATGGALEVGLAVHAGRLPEPRLGEVAPLVVRAAVEGDAPARQLVQRLADEIALLAARAIADLDLGARPVDVVLGGGMLRRGGLTAQLAAARMAELAPEAVARFPSAPPVLGALLAGLEAMGAGADAARRLRAAFAGAVAAQAPAIA